MLLGLCAEGVHSQERAEHNAALFCSMRWSDNGGQIHWRNHQGLVQCDVGCQSRKWYANYKGEAIKNYSNLDSFFPNFLRCVKKSR